MDQQPPVEPVPSIPPPQPTPTVSPPEPVGPEYWKNPKPRWLKYLLLVVLLAIIAVGVDWIWKNPAPNSPNQSTASNTQAQTPPAATAATETQHYSSSNFNLSFDYPTNWTVTDSGNDQLTVRSTTMTLTDANAQSVSGQVIMTIAKKGQNLGVFSSGSAVAVLDSQKIAYTKPTQDQRADTYLSFLQYADTSTTGALDAVYITGDFGYQKGQDIPKTDIAKIDPLVTVTFVKCANSACPAGTATALSLASSSWSNTGFSGPITKMLESLAFN